MSRSRGPRSRGGRRGAPCAPLSAPWSVCLVPSPLPGARPRRGCESPARALTPSPSTLSSRVLGSRGQRESRPTAPAIPSGSSVPPVPSASSVPRARVDTADTSVAKKHSNHLQRKFQPRKGGPRESRTSLLVLVSARGGAHLACLRTGGLVLSRRSERAHLKVISRSIQSIALVGGDVSISGFRPDGPCA